MTTTSTLKLDRSQLSKVAKGDPEVVRQLEALIARVNALVSSGGGGAVDSVNGQTGVVVLDAGDVGADASGTAAALVGALATIATTGSASDLVAGTVPVVRLPLTAVTPGSYTNTSLTVDATGRITAASNGVDNDVRSATITVPFGAQDQTVTVVDAAILTTSKVLVGWGQTTDDDENQPMACDVTFSAAAPAAGSVAVTVSSNDDNNVGGVYKILYTVSG